MGHRRALVLAHQNICGVVDLELVVPVHCKLQLAHDD